MKNRLFKIFKLAYIIEYIEFYVNIGKFVMWSFHNHTQTISPFWKTNIENENSIYTLQFK